MKPLPVVLVVLSLAAPAGAQQAPPQRPATADRPSVDVDRLPLNLNRIRRELQHAADIERRDGLNLRYTVQIYGAAPPLDLFGPDTNLKTGPVPYGAPTHQEMIDFVTPQEFRTPVMDFSALMRWLAERSKKQ